jgi:N-acyl-D-aspartate/D-glutamate deacylase
MVRDALRRGCRGVSIGLAYPPCHQVTAEELERTLLPLREFDVPLVVHARSYFNRYDAAVGELISLAEKMRIHVHFSHHTGAFFDLRTRRRAEQSIGEARERGAHITYDCILRPIAYSSALSLIHPRLFERTAAETVARIGSERDAFIESMAEQSYAVDIKGKRYVYDNVFNPNIRFFGLTAEAYRAFEGRPLGEAADALGVDPREALRRMLVSHGGRLFFLDSSIAEDKFGENRLNDILRDRECSIVTDAIGMDFTIPYTDPALLYARLFSVLVKERGVLGFPEAVHKLTGLPASQMGLTERGLIAEGFLADMLLWKDDHVAAPGEAFSESLQRVIFSGSLCGDRGHG